MAKLGISTGTVPNDGMGDSLLDGAIKINNNFNEIYNYLGDGTNLTAIGGTWVTTTVGIHTLKNVGIGTTNPTSTLTVSGNVSISGILTSSSAQLSLLLGTNSNYSGISTVGSLSIGSNQVISSGRELQNIASLDATTTATIESAIQSAPNNFNNLNVSGVSTLGNTIVGGATTQLVVNGDARITGILTIGSSSITLNGSSNTINVGSGITINGSTGIISATSIVINGTSITGGGVTSITAGSGISVDQSTGNVTITATGGGGGSSQWVSTGAGIHTTSNVGIGTTNPTSALTVSGVTSTTSLFSTNDATIDRLIIAQNSISGTGNIKIGDSNTLSTSGGSSQYNIGIGQQALNNIRGGGYNIAIGYQASQQSNIGNIGVNNNISIGHQAFRNLSSGSTNVAIGNYSLYGTTTSPSHAGGNVSIGSGAGYYSRSVRFNDFIGENSGYNLDSGDWNTFLGWQSGYNITSANYNIYLGVENGSYSTVGENRIVIGNGNGSFSNIKFDAPTSGGKQLAIGFNTSGTSEYWLVGNSSLNIGIGTTNPTSKLHVVGDVNVSGVVTATAFVGDGSGLTNLPGGGGGGESYWVSTSAGIHTLSNVGIGTTNPTSRLTVYDGSIKLQSPGKNPLDISQLVDDTFIIRSSGNDPISIAPGNIIRLTVNTSGASVTGILTATSFVGDGSGLTGVVGSGSGVVIKDSGSIVGTAGTIDFGDNLTVSAISAGVVTVTASGGGSSQWVTTAAGIHTLSNVGVGTTNPRTPLQVENVYGIKTGFGTFTASAGIAYTADSFTISSTDFKTVEYTLHVGYGSSIQAQKVLAMQNGTNAYSQEYAIMYEPSAIVSVAATITSGEFRLHIIPEVGVNGLATYRLTRQSML